jgi:hypothetical protein
MHQIFASPRHSCTVRFTKTLPALSGRFFEPSSSTLRLHVTKTRLSACALSLCCVNKAHADFNLDERKQTPALLFQSSTPPAPTSTNSTLSRAKTRDMSSSKGSQSSSTCALWIIKTWPPLHSLLASTCLSTLSLRTAPLSHNTRLLASHKARLCSSHLINYMYSIRTFRVSLLLIDRRLFCHDPHFFKGPDYSAMSLTSPRAQTILQLRVLPPTHFAASCGPAITLCNDGLTLSCS